MPIVCDYTVSGVCSEAEGVLVEGGSVYFCAPLHGTAPIEVVEMISSRKCVWQGKPDAWDVELEGVELPVPEGESAYLLFALAPGRWPLRVVEPGVA